MSQRRTIRANALLVFVAVTSKKTVDKAKFRTA